MSENIAVVAGSGVAAAAGLPTLHALDLSGGAEGALLSLSPTSYGNHLPEFWTHAVAAAKEALKKKPTGLHEALAREGWPVISQNIGGICHRAGVTNLVEVYGSLFAGRCLRCQHEWPLDEAFLTSFRGEVPPCPACGKARTRPTVVLPGEGERHRRQVERILQKANHVIYLGVEEGSGPATQWYQKVPCSILVARRRWGAFTKWIPMDPQEWYDAGMPRSFAEGPQDA